MTIRSMKSVLTLVAGISLYSNAQPIPQGFRHLDCTIRPIGRLSSKNRSKKRHPRTHPHIHVKEGTSANWCGYTALAGKEAQKSSVTSASGSWQVPKILSSRQNSYCAVWVGIDGYTSPTVEQIGTEHDCINGKQTNYAWFEMYPNHPYQISGFPLDINDSVGALVRYIGNNIFELSLFNYTKKRYTTVPTKFTTSSVAQRISAEWVVEAPYLQKILPLSHFTTVTFAGCQATINGATGSISNGAWIKDSLVMATASVTKAVPSSLSANGQRFTVTWVHQ